jgi:hypothetical protein
MILPRIRLTFIPDLTGTGTMKEMCANFTKLLLYSTVVPFEQNNLNL